MRQAGISVCAGGIIGLGEGHMDRCVVGVRRGDLVANTVVTSMPVAHPTIAHYTLTIRSLYAHYALTRSCTRPISMDRIGLFHQLATLPAHPESVPINALVAVKGTPFQDHEAPTGLDIARCVATARILMPKTVVRLSAGRMNFSFADQALCFLAGANSIFDGDKLLTTPNNDRNEDLEMFDMLGLRSRPAFLPYESGQESSKEAFDAPSGSAEKGGSRGSSDGKETQKMTA